MPVAFPGASGWGAQSVGGRGGVIKEVTNLNDSGAGSFRAACDASGPRIVIPRVAGTITLASKINLTNPYITFAGQAGPGSGIVLTGNHIEISTHNVILQYLSWRGDGTDWQNFINIYTYNSAHDIILDHLSACWATTETIMMWFENGREADDDIENITVQNCLLAEPLDNGGNHEPSLGLIGANTTGIDKVDRIHNISAHNNFYVSGGWNRCPAFKAQYFEMVNNVGYNMRDGVTYFMAGPTNPAIGDFVNNHWLDGPMGPNTIDRMINQEVPFDSPTNSIYVAGNYCPDRGITDPAADNWPLCNEHGNGWDEVDTKHKRVTRMTLPAAPCPEVPAADILTRVCANAGNHQRINSVGEWEDRRDTLDTEFVRQAEEDDGIASLPTSAGSLPDTVAGTAYTDTDGDGMPDDWESAQGLDPNDASDGPLVRESGYTNVENFLNGAQEEENGEGGGGSVPSPVVILGASSTPQRSLSENTEIDEFWEGYFQDIEKAQQS